MVREGPQRQERHKMSIPRKRREVRGGWGWLVSLRKELSRKDKKGSGLSPASSGAFSYGVESSDGAGASLAWTRWRKHRQPGAPQVAEAVCI